jgi:hypothetical protein
LMDMLLPEEWVVNIWEQLAEANSKDDTPQVTTATVVDQIIVVEKD